MLITWHIVKLVLVLIVVFNEIAALITVFRERRDICNLGLVVGLDLNAGRWLYLLFLFGSQAPPTALGTDPNGNPIRTFGGSGQAKGPVLTLAAAQATDLAHLQADHYAVSKH